MQTRAPFEIPNASAAAFARTLFRSRSDTIKRQRDAWRGRRYKNIGSHSSLSSPTPFFLIARIRETIAAAGNFLVGESRDGFREYGKSGKRKEKAEENGLQRREKFQSTRAFLSNSLLIWERGRRGGGWSEPPTLHARKTFVIFHCVFPSD